MSTTDLVRSAPADAYLISPVMDLAAAKQRLLEFQSFVKDYLVEGEDFGTIPGTPKPTLLKPGADKLCELYGLSDDYEFIERVEDYDRGIFDYTIKCILTSRRHGVMVSAGFGSCSSLESKYRWRDSKRVCPQCSKDTIAKSKEEYGGGWYCNAKRGGCGKKFAPTDPAIVDQVIGRSVNEDVADQKNTILKVAKKRAKIDATLSATRSSGIFTQDIEDMPGAGRQEQAEQTPSENAKKNGPAIEYWSKLLRDCTNFADFDMYVISKWGEPNGKGLEAVKEFLRVADKPMLADLWRLLPTVEEFNRVIPKLNQVAIEVRKPFIGEAAEEAKRRGYKVNRTTGIYEEGGAK
jgi:hypothetical protein